jgi:hypothetical protein
MNNLQKIIDDFLTPDISLNALEEAKRLSKEEIVEGIEKHYNFKTSKLFLSLISWTNLDCFLKSENKDLLDEVKNWVLNQPEMLKISGQVNIENKNFKFDDILHKKIFIAFNFHVNTEDLVAFEHQLDLLEENKNVFFKANLILEKNQFTLVMGSDKINESPEANWWKEKLVTPVKALTLCAILFTANQSFADDSSRQALNHAKDFVMAQPEVQEVKKEIDKKLKKAEKEATEAVKDTPAEIPVVVIGYGIKTVVDQKVEVKGKIPSLAVPMDYDLAVGFDGSVQMGVGGSNPLIKDSTYKLQGGRMDSGHHKIEMKLNFEF